MGDLLRTNIVRLSILRESRALDGCLDRFDLRFELLALARVKPRQRLSNLAYSFTFSQHPRDVARLVGVKTDRRRNWRLSGRKSSGRPRLSSGYPACNRTLLRLFIAYPLAA